MKEKLNGNSSSHMVTEDEAALYDRQIRLWGLPAQKRLRGSRVLIVGIKGLGAEVCKNIVLAGIKSLTVMDHTEVDNEDRCAQFFCNKSDIGTNRAICSLPKIQQLNPTVEVIANTENVENKEDNFFLQFDIVCLTNCTPSIALKVNDICRQNKIHFIMGAVHGIFGYCFMDFGEHEYQEELLATSGDNTGAPPSKKLKMDDHNPETKKISYVSLKHALSVQCSISSTKKKRAKFSTSYFLMKALHNFQNQQGKNPSVGNEGDAALLKEILQKELQDAYDERLIKSCVAELSPICAIVGGVFSQEIIKVLSRTEQTYNNFFFYNGLDGTGLVECVSN